MKQIDYSEYVRRVQELVDEGWSRKDAETIVNTEMEKMGEEIYSPFETINS